MWEVLFNTRQLKEWVEAAKKIHARFGIEKALGYLMKQQKGDGSIFSPSISNQSSLELKRDIQKLQVEDALYRDYQACSFHEETTTKTFLPVGIIATKETTFGG